MALAGPAAAQSAVQPPPPVQAPPVAPQAPAVQPGTVTTPPVATATDTVLVPVAKAPTVVRSDAPRPWGRISFLTYNSRITPDEGTPLMTNQLVTSVTYELTDGEGDGLEYALDFRRADYMTGGRDPRLSIYDAFVGMRTAGGQLRVRVGDMWLTDLGGLGAIAGGLVEYRESLPIQNPGRLRAGAFYGVEPTPYTLGYVNGIRKFGGYAALEGSHGRKHALGYIHLTNGSLTERSVVTFTNFVPVKSKVFVYQSGEYDLVGPAHQGKGGLTYFFVNGRVSPTTRVDLQGTYHHGRSIDARSIADDILNGRALRAGAVEGLLFESVGGRVTVEVVRRVRVNAGYTRDKNNRDSTSTGRLSVGLSASDIAGSGFDLTVSDSETKQPTGNYSSLYLSVGRQIGRAVYVSGDYSSSLSVVRLAQSDGVTVESRPATRQLGGSAIVSLGRHLSLLVTAERLRDDTTTDLRLMSGITYRFR